MQDVHADLWKGANRKFDKVPWRKIEMERHNAERTPEQQVITHKFTRLEGPQLGHNTSTAYTFGGHGLIWANDIVLLASQPGNTQHGLVSRG